MEGGLLPPGSWHQRLCPKPLCHLLSPLAFPALPGGVLSTYLDDPAGVFPKVGQALQLARGRDRAGQCLEHGGRSAEGQEAALAAFEACRLCQRLQSLLQGGALSEGRGRAASPQPSSCHPPVPKAGEGRVGSALREARRPRLTERLLLWCVRGVGRWQA